MQTSEWASDCFHFSWWRCPNLLHASATRCLFYILAIFHTLALLMSLTWLFPFIIEAVSKEDERLINKVKKLHIWFDPQHPFYCDILKKEEVWRENGKLFRVTRMQIVPELCRNKPEPRKLRLSFTHLQRENHKQCTCTLLFLYMDNFLPSICSSSLACCLLGSGVMANSDSL